MEVILLERIEKLGQMGDVVTVKPGFARNFLLPQNKALRATKENVAVFETQKKELEARNLDAKNEAESVAKQVDGKSLIVIRQAGESGQLYGSVQARDISDGMKEQGVSIDRRQVEIGEPIKSLGLHPVTVRLHPEVVVEITVNVAKTEEEALVQAEMGRAVTEEERLEGDVQDVIDEGISEDVAEEFFENPEEIIADAEEERLAGQESEEGTIGVTTHDDGGGSAEEASDEADEKTD